MNALIYLYDGTLEGLFSAIFAAYANRVAPEEILCASDAQLALFCDSQAIATCEEHALRVRNALCAKFGNEEYERIKTAFLSDQTDRGTIIYRYVAYALATGPGAWNNLTHASVAPFEKLWKSVYNERHRILQFLRFSRLASGVYFAQINPNANVVPLIMEHFAARFNSQPFLIYDKVHNLAGIWDLQQWRLAPTDTIDIGAYAPDEQAYQDMWKTFYDHVCNQQRYNPRLRMQFMPKRLWENITEMNPLATTQAKKEAGVCDGILHAAEHTAGQVSPWASEQPPGQPAESTGEEPLLAPTRSLPPYKPE